MNKHIFTACRVFLAVVLSSLASSASASVTVTGDIDPFTDPTTWTAKMDAYIGKTAVGKMDITGGSDVSNRYGYIGYESTATGHVTVKGSGSTWTNSGDLGVGNYGYGTLDIINGGAVSNYYGYINAFSDVTVDGSGSTWTNSDNLLIGCAGDGTLNISRGGAVSSADGFIGYYGSGSTGKVTVDGSSSRWTNSNDLYVGYSVDGMLNISNGGQVSNALGYIGHQSTSSGAVTVDGSDSTWTNSADVHVGYYGTGTLNIKNGGTVSNADHTYIGCFPSVTGEVTVDGPDSTWTNTSSVYIGYQGDATLAIKNGGSVRNTYGYIGRYLGSTASVTVSGPGSTWTNTHYMYVGHNGNGTLNITNGGTVSNWYSYIGNFWSSTGSASVSGPGSTWTTGSNLFVGHYDAGILYVTNGGIVSVGGALTIDFDGGDDSFINIATGGMLALFGEADNSLTDFLALIDGSDDIRYWDDSISNWADITGATYGDDYRLQYLTTGDLAGYTLLTVGFIPGDFDGDGDVDGVDFGLWQVGYGMTSGATRADGDADGDGDVDGVDFGIWQTNYTPPGLVPEPTTMALLTLGALAVLQPSRRR